MKNKDSDYINEHPDYYGEKEGNRMSDPQPVNDAIEFYEWED